MRRLSNAFDGILFKPLNREESSRRACHLDLCRPRCKNSKSLPDAFRLQAMRLSLLILAVLPCPLLAAEPTGAELYASKCASCHGGKGEGTKTYKRSLEGDRSILQLSKYVAETMPEDDPGSVSAAEAEKISAYLHDAFYSPVARDRNRPARVELARLTVPQYRNSVADLVNQFRWNANWGDKRGLNGEYYKGRNHNKNERVIERLDAEVAFDFGKETPETGKFPDPHQFAISWNGSILPEETGNYDFVIRTEQAMQFWINDLEKPAIDATVKSGMQSEYVHSVYLVAGRAYPIRLNFSKAKQGVDDSKKNPKRPVLPAGISLNWKPPRGAVETIPSRVLSPVNFPEQFALGTPFPPDDRSLGWERGTAVSKEWDAAATDAALETATYVSAKINDLAKTTDAAPDRLAKLKEFAKTFAERAFRRPLSDDQKKLIEKQFDPSRGTDVSIKRVVLIVLKSPLFLYREVGGQGDAFDTASRLSFGLWDSIPDAELHEAATQGRLKTREQVLAQATRMLDSPRAKPKVRQFFHHWLNVEQAGELGKDAKRFAGFDPQVVADLRTSLDQFVGDIVWGKSPEFKRLLSGDEIPLNGRLAKLYGAELPADAKFTAVKLDPGQRSGVLTHPYILANFAYTSESSPIHRGVFLTRGVLGLSLRPPPEAVAPLLADLHPSLNTRERVSLQTKAQNCMTCHGIINPLGFTLEKFDAIGRYRTQDNTKVVDDTGSYLARDGQAITLKGPVELGKYLANSPEVHAAFAVQVFHHVAQQPIRAYGPTAHADLTKKFTDGGFDVRKLFAEAAVTMASRAP